MFERELTLYEFMWGYLKLVVADLDDAHLQTAAYQGGNPPVWILGHLALATDYAGQLLGLKPACPKQWHKQFGPGSNPAALEPPLPNKDELMAAIDAGYHRVREAVPSASADVMNQPHSIELLKPTNLKTNGDVLAHLMTTHQSFHVAQLSACRRVSGKGPIV